MKKNYSKYAIAALLAAAFSLQGTADCMVDQQSHVAPVQESLSWRDHGKNLMRDAWKYRYRLSGVAIGAAFLINRSSSSSAAGGQSGAARALAFSPRSQSPFSLTSSSSSSPSSPLPQPGSLGRGPGHGKDAGSQALSELAVVALSSSSSPAARAEATISNDPWVRTEQAKLLHESGNFDGHTNVCVRIASSIYAQDTDTVAVDYCMEKDTILVLKEAIAAALHVDVDRITIVAYSPGWTYFFGDEVNAHRSFLEIEDDANKKESDRTINRKRLKKVGTEQNLRIKVYIKSAILDHSSSSSSSSSSAAAGAPTLAATTSSSSSSSSAAAGIGRLEVATKRAQQHNTTCAEVYLEVVGAYIKVVYSKGDTMSDLKEAVARVLNIHIDSIDIVCFDNKDIRERYTPDNTTIVHKSLFLQEYDNDADFGEVRIKKDLSKYEFRIE